MKKYLVALAVGVCCLSGHSVQAVTAAGKGEALSAKRMEKITRFKEHCAERYAARTDKRTTRHAAFLAKLNAKLTRNDILSASEKTEIVAFFEEQYKENTEFRSAQYEANTRFLDGLSESIDLPKSEFRAKIKEHVTSQKALREAHRAMQKKQRKAERKKIRAAHPVAAKV